MNRTDRILLAQQARPVAPLSSMGADCGSTGQVSVPKDNAVQIFNPRKRCSVAITNLAQVDIYIGFNNSVNLNSGHLLIGIRGAFITIDTVSPLWAIADRDGAKVSFIEYYR